jgi:predicted helicase
MPNKRGDWLVAANATAFESFVPIGSKLARASDEPTSDLHVIFKDYSLGVATHRDAVVYDFDREVLTARVNTFIDDYNGEVDRWKRAPAGSDVEEFVKYDRVVWDRDLKRDLTRGKYAEFANEKLRGAVYRPFCRKHLFFDRLLNAEIYGIYRFFPANKPATNTNVTIAIGGYDRKGLSAFVADSITDLNLYVDPAQAFPFYVYDEDGTNRRENITDWALKQFRDHYKDKKIDKWAIFHYVYGLLHHPGYREKFADNLKRELPRIPFAPDFRAFAEAGAKLATLHLDYEKLEPWALEFQETPGEPLSYRVEDKMRLGKDKTRLVVNKSLALSGIPPETLEYRLGNRSALEWVIDQYQVSTDKRSGITSDPNRADDEQYIVRLVGQVVRVSVETVKIVKGLPLQFA